MQTRMTLVSLAAFVLAALLAWGAALGLASLFERRTADALASAYADEGITWVTIASDGLRVTLSGSAPDESGRIRALQVAGRVVDAARVDEAITVPQNNAVVAPVFRIEVMRNRHEVSVIGLVPAQNDAAPILQRLADAVDGAEITDMLQTADNAVPGGWVAAVDFAVEALTRFETGRISVTAGRIEVEALVENAEDRRTLEDGLRALAPRGQVLMLDLIAPRPLLAPFPFRLELEAGAARLLACAADTEAAQRRIEAALRTAGFTARFSCPLALGTPSPRWSEAVESSIAALQALGTGSLTLADGVVTLTAPHTVAADVFDRAIGRLETALPTAFALTSERLAAPVTEGPVDPRAAEVVMEVTEAGHLTIDGRLPDSRIREAVSVIARARFGAGSVDMAARIDEGLPNGWSMRVLAALEALAELHHGRAVVRADTLAVSGVSGNPDVANQASQAITQALGASAVYTLDVRYDEALDPVAQAPTPDNCEQRIQAILAQTKFTFDPGSLNINEASGRVLDAIADVMRDCGELPFLVAGYTDSQGRDETNLALSQARAEAVINALLARRVLVAALEAQGFGAANPIGDNATETGREANRRIEFTLIRPEPEPEPLDPALEAQLIFAIRTPTADTVRPQPRPERDGAPAENDLEGTDEPAAEN